MRTSSRPIPVRRALAVVLISPAMLLAACGGGGTDALDGGCHTLVLDFPDGPAVLLREQDVERGW